MIDLKMIQKEIGEWAFRNFPSSGDVDAVMGIGEEYGELLHTVLKKRQGVRQSKDPRANDEAMKDAIGDMLIYMMHFCYVTGLDLEQCLLDTWYGVVSKRDWITYPKNGVSE